MLGSAGLRKPLTSIRGIMALWVVLYHVLHVLNPSLRQAIGGFDPILSRGYLAVDFFFILSGFILCYVYKNKFEYRPKCISSLKHFIVTFKSFIWARFARIYPMHLFALLVLILLEVGKGLHIIPWYDGKAPFQDDKSLAKLIPNLLLIQAWPIISPTSYTTSWNVVAWSVSVEWLAYFLFPLSCWFAQMQKKSILLALLAFLSVLEFIFCAARPDSSLEFCYSVFRCLPAFLSGIILYLLTESASKWREFEKNINSTQNEIPPTLTLPRKGRGDLSFIKKRNHFETRVFQSDWISLLCVGFLLLLIQLGIRDPYIVIGMGFLLFCVAQNSGKFQAFLSWRPLFWIGEISFSIYMIHLVLYPYWVTYMPNLLWGSDWADHSPGRVAILSMTLAFIPALLIASWFTYFFIEKPCRDRLKGLMPKS